MGHNREQRKTYQIKKIFGPTFQGEGSHVGRKVLFIRFTGCNRWNGRPETKAKSACPFCDTDFFKGKPKTIDDIVQRLIKLNGHHFPRLPVILSGGEPSLQVDEAFIIGLIEEFPEVHIETNGSKKLKRPKLFKHITLSPKQPIEQTKLQFCHDLKILYPFINNEITLEKFLEFPSKRVYIQPIEMDGFNSKLSVLNRVLTRDFIMNTNIPTKEIRLSAQIHKLMEIE